MAALSPTAVTRSVQITQNLLSVSCVWPHGSHANASVQGIPYLEYVLSQGVIRTLSIFAESAQASLGPGNLMPGVAALPRPCQTK